jgi:putative mRNA 3-end processing factor
MVKITFLGGAREVGRMGLLFESSGKRLLWEYGINVQDMGVPRNPGTNLDGAFITHAHIDHSGYTPRLYKDGYKGPLYATSTTLDLMAMLLRDSIKVQKKKGLEPQFMPHDIETLERERKKVGFGERVKLGEVSVTAYSAGHIPGAASYLLEAEGKKVLFTGDIKFMETALVRGAKSDYKNLDVVIIESTYSYKNHPDRNNLIDRLREICQETCYNNGLVLLPAFAVGRTQELLINLYDLGFPVYVDGMGIEATERMLNNPEHLRDANLLRKAFGKARKIGKQRDRDEAVKKPGVIISTAGMMNGGPVNFYMKKLHHRGDCSLVTTGYMVEGTVGRHLIDTGRYVNEGLDVKPKMRMEFLDMSAHTDKDHIIGFLKKVSPRRIFLVHGDHNLEFEKSLKSMGFNVDAPKIGDTVKV